MKAYVTGTSGKYFKTAHCIVNLYRSVSRKEMTPSGKGDEPLNSIVTMGEEHTACGVLAGTPCSGVEMKLNAPSWDAHQ